MGMCGDLPCGPNILIRKHLKFGEPGADSFEFGGGNFNRFTSAFLQS